MMERKVCHKMMNGAECVRDYMKDVSPVTAVVSALAAYGLFKIIWGLSRCTMHKKDKYCSKSYD